MARFAAWVYGVLVYIAFFLTFLYAIAFVENALVPKTIDAGGVVFSVTALVIDLLLLGLFAVQHSVMARQGFKRVWTKLIPQPIERSTYVLFSTLCLILLFWLWQPMRGIVWSVANPTGRWILIGLSLLGWVIVLVSTMLISHTDLFGLRQVAHYARGKEYEPIGFKAPGFYKAVRHPIYLGFTLAFWAAPDMTIGHLVFAVATLGYILLAIQLEERDLIFYFGEAYREYKRRTPMLVPLPKKHK